jgi:hypothetical protein
MLKESFAFHILPKDQTRQYRASHFEIKKGADPKTSAFQFILCILIQRVLPKQATS